MPRMIDADKLRERLHAEYQKLHAEYHRTDFPPLKDTIRGKLNMLMKCMEMVREAPTVGEGTDGT